MAVYRPKRKISVNGTTEEVKFPASCIEGLSEATGLNASAASDAASNVLMEENNKLVYMPLSKIRPTYGLDSFGVTASAKELNYCAGVTSNIQTQLNSKASSNHSHSYVPLTGGTMNQDASLKFSLWGTRSLTITGNSIDADMSKETGGWAGNFASVKDPAGDVTPLLGWYGDASKLNWIYMGGTYNNPYMKMTKDGQFTFKNTVAASINGNASTATKLANARSIKLTGDATGSASFDGSGDASITVTVADDSHNHVISNIDGLQAALNEKEASGAANTALTNAKTYTDEKIAALINSAPTTLDTLGEIATAMQNNESVVQALEEAIGSKASSSHTHSNYVDLTSTQTIGGAKTFSSFIKTCENAMGTKLRTHDSYETGWVYGTTGNEAVTLAMQNPVTAFQIVYGTKPSAFAGGTWQTVTPLFQTKDGKVIINRKIAATADTSALKLFDVNGDANATTLYESGTKLADKYQAKGNYMTSLPTRLASSSTSAIASADSATEQGWHYIGVSDSKKPAFKQVDGQTGNDYRVMTTAYSGSWWQQIATDFRSNDIFIRRNQNGTIQPWTPIVKMQQGASPCPVDNTIPRWDADRNATLQSSGVTIDDNNNLTANYLTGTWLQTKSASAVTTTSKIAVIDSSGWIYYMTPDSMKALLGVPSFSYSSGKLTITRG